MPIIDTASGSIADQAPAEWVWGDRHDGVLERAVDIATFVTGDSEDLIPMLVIKASVSVSPTTITPKVHR